MPTPNGYARHPTLVVNGTLLAVLGLAFALIAVAFPNLLAKLYALIATGDTVADAGPSSRLATGIYGGLMFGWGVMLAMLGRGSSIARATVLGALAWFVVDSTSSILVGFAWNAASNALFLAPFVVMLPSLRGALQREATRA